MSRIFRTTVALVLPFACMFAIPALAQNAPDSSQCLGPVQCCDMTYPSDSYEAKVIMKAFKIDESSAPKGVIAMACNVGGGSTCQGIPVCCDDDYMGLRILGFGCEPV
ncbi:hypothetical protein B0H21DRAFT_710270 [Amylocystis lapponica]|nr:hypothetical protein B0H21DRAFT_710270 [Amylocystis lapponica]